MVKEALIIRPAISEGGMLGGCRLTSHDDGNSKIDHSVLLISTNINILIKDRLNHHKDKS